MLPIQVKASVAGKFPDTATKWMRLRYDPRTQIQEYSGPTEITDPDLIYVYVVIDLGSRKDRYFVLEKSDVQNVYVKHYTTWMESKKWQRPRRPDSFDCRPTTQDFQGFEDNWSLIHSRLE